MSPYTLYSVSVLSNVLGKSCEISILFFKPYSHITTEMYSVSKQREITVSELGRVGHP